MWFKFFKTAYYIADSEQHGTVVNIVYYRKSKRCFVQITNKYTPKYDLSLPVKHFKWLCKSLDSGRWKGSFKNNRCKVFYSFNGHLYHIYQKTPRFKKEFQLSVQEVRNMIRWQNTVYEMFRNLKINGEMAPQDEEMVEPTVAPIHNPESIDFKEDNAVEYYTSIETNDI